jgi:hypothetical protein
MKPVAKAVIFLAGAILFGGVIGAALPSPPRIRGTNGPIVEAGCARPDEGDLSTHGCYINRDGNAVHRPAQDRSKPAGDTALCRDGSYSFSRHASGTCSHHGGVHHWD